MAVLDNGYWTITASANPTSGNYNMTLYNTNYTPSGAGWTVVKSPTAPPTAGSWALSGTCVPPSTMPQTMRNGMNGFSSFGVGVSNTPLPIELLRFAGFAAGNENILEWETATEINNDYFSLERSKDGINFNEFAKMKGAGNSFTTLYYKTTDDDPFHGITYYRLKQTDFNGHFSYSDVIAVVNEQEDLSLANLHPNPSLGIFEFDFFTPQDAIILIRVCDSYGRELKKEILSVGKGSNHFATNLEAFPKGIYQLSVTDLGSDKSVTRKLVRY